MGPLAPKGHNGAFKRDRQRRIELLVVAALSLIGAAVAIELVRRKPDESALAAVGPMPWTMRPTTPGLEPASEPPASEAQGQDLTFGRLMEILGTEAEKPPFAPVAKAFAKEFLAKSDLRKTYGDFKALDKRGKRPTAKSFLGALRGMPAFQKLAAQFGQGTGSGAIMAIARHPDVRRVMRQLDSDLGGKGGKQAINRDRRAASMRAGAQSGQSLDFMSRMAGLGGALAPMGLIQPGSGHDSFNTSGSAGMTQGSSVDPAAIGAGDAGRSGGVTVGAGGRSKDTPPTIEPPPSTIRLPPINDARSRRMLKLLERYPWLRHVGETDVWRLIAGNAIDQYGLWGACFSLGIYAKCRAACEQGNIEEPGSCAPMDGWKACLDWKGSSAHRPCIAACQEQPPCAAPDTIWQTYCVQKRGADELLLPPPPPYPECGLTSDMACANDSDPYTADDCSTFDSHWTEEERAKYRRQFPSLSEDELRRAFVSERNRDVWAQRGREDAGWRREYGPDYLRRHCALYPDSPECK